MLPSAKARLSTGLANILLEAWTLIEHLAAIKVKFSAGLKYLFEHILVAYFIGVTDLRGVNICSSFVRAGREHALALDLYSPLARPVASAKNSRVPEHSRTMS